jgi:hypothetical protein
MQHTRVGTLLAGLAVLGLCATRLAAAQQRQAEVLLEQAMHVEQVEGDLQRAISLYQRILTEHPLSERVQDAKGRLTAMKQPIPRPTKAILARAEADAVHNKTGWDPLSKLGGMMSSRPDTSATRRGPVSLGPPAATAARAIGDTLSRRPVP